jgi:hypothetical protein
LIDYIEIERKQLIQVIMDDLVAKYEVIIKEEITEN